jgi:hypothetical protein
MAAVSPWFATTRMLLEIRALRARLGSSRSNQGSSADENGRNSPAERPSAVR